MPENLDALLAAIRKTCLPGLWSQGVKLAREGAVFAQEARGDSIVARVKTPGVTVAPTVTLYPADEEWTCDCGGKMDPCAHVAAAAIAMAQGTPLAEGKPEAAPAPAPKRSARLSYRLSQKDGALRLERWVVHPDGREEPFKGSFPAKSGGVQPTHEDLTLDRLLGARQFGVLPPDRIAEVFAGLASAPDVRWEGRPTKISTELLLPRASVVDDPASVALLLERDPRITRVITAGVVLAGDTLHRLGETELTGSRLEKLPLRRVFAWTALGTLVAQILPDLKKRIPVEIKTRRLPESHKGARPRIHFELSQRDHTLSVVPSLVYGDPPEARIEGGALVHLGGRVPDRDEAKEREILTRLRDDLNLIPDRSVHFDGIEAIRFAQRLAAFSAREGTGEPRELFGKASLVPRVHVDDRDFDITFELAAEDGAAEPQRADPAAVIRAYQDGLPFVPLLGGGFAPLPQDWLARYGDRIADLLAARGANGKISTAALPTLAELCDAMEQPRPPSLDRLAPLLEGFERLPEAPLPSDLTATLRPYQRQGVSWLSFLRDAGLGAVLADDMGLGKTLEALCAVRGRTLVVCPRSVVHNWAAEIQRFRPGLRCSIYHGPKRALDRAAAITLTTYALLRLDAELLGSEAWDTVVLDEAQAIKNPDSQVARAAYALRGDFCMSLSGTPVENRLEELWSQLHFTNRGLLGGRSDFEARYARPIAEGNPAAAAKLRQKIRPFVLRRRKSEVAPELPPRTEAVLYCELEEAERDVYEAIQAATRSEVVRKLAEGASVLMALEALLRLRQAACHPALVPGQTAETSSKVERLVEALLDAAADGHKALVFSQWTSLLDLVEPRLREVGIGFTRLDGSTRDRGAVVDVFQSAGGPPVMLISLKAGGTGLNLTAADHVFLLDPWWNPAVEDQAADRAHRIGQDKPVMVYRLVAKDTVEEGILALAERKRATAEAALGEADQAVGLTRDDLLSLLT